MAEKKEHTFLDNLFSKNGGSHIFRDDQDESITDEKQEEKQETSPVPESEFSAVSAPTPEKESLPVKETISESVPQPSYQYRAGIITESNKGLDDYSAGLERFRRSRSDVEIEKKKYEKELLKYRGYKAQFDEMRGVFSDTESSLLEEKNVYDADNSAYEKAKELQTTIQRSYQEVSLTFDALTKDYTEYHNELGTKQRLFNESKNIVRDLAALFEEADKGFQAQKSDLSELDEKVKGLSDDFSQISELFQAASQEYGDNKKSFDEAKAKFENARQVQNDYRALADDFSKVSEQLDEAQKVYKNAVQTSETSYNQLTIAQETDKFANSFSLDQTDTLYKEQVDALEQVEIRFNQLEKKHTQAKNLLNRIQTDYDTIFTEGSENSAQASRLSTHFVTSELEQTKQAFASIEAAFGPLQKEYSLKKEILALTKKNYDVLKSMKHEAEGKLKIAREEFEEAETAHRSAEDAARALETQKSTLQQNLTEVEAPYKEIEQDIEHISQVYFEEERKFPPVIGHYFETKKNYDSVNENLREAQEGLDMKQVLFEQSKGKVAEVMQLFDKAKTSLDKHQEDFLSSQEQLNDAESKLHAANEELDKVTQQKKENEEKLENLYKKATNSYGVFSITYKDYQNLYQQLYSQQGRTVPLYNEVLGNYNAVFQAYEALERAHTEISARYQVALDIYNRERGYFEALNSTFENLKSLQNQVLANKKEFDLAAAKVKAVLVQGGSLTFPIYESTGYNYVDEYNLPRIDYTRANTVVLAARPQYDTWKQVYSDAFEKLQTSSLRFSQSLQLYKDSFIDYRKAGGERFSLQLGPETPFEGIDVLDYVQAVSNEVGHWEAQYKEREAAFAKLLSVYYEYIERKNQLSNLVRANSSSQEDIYTAIQSVNSIPDYADIYSADYSNIAKLARLLSVNPADLTKPRPVSFLMGLLQEKYYQRSLSLIEKGLSTFGKKVDVIKVNYQKSLDDLRNELQQFERVTGISTAQIHIESVFNEDINFESYLKNGLSANYEALRMAVTGVSSFINVIKRASSLKKVINYVINVAVDTTMSFGEQKIMMSEDLLNSEVKVNTAKALPVPLEPKKPENLFSTSPSPLPITVLGKPIEGSHQPVPFTVE